MTLEEQLLWEEECLNRGCSLYIDSQDSLRDKSQHTRCDAMKHIISDRLKDVEEVTKELVEDKGAKAGKYYIWRKIIRNITQGNYAQVAYISTKVAISNAAESKNQNTVVTNIARHIETELKCQLFEATHPEYFDKIRASMKKQKVTSRRHQYITYMKKFQQFELSWQKWSASECIHIGGLLLHAVLNVYGDLIQIKKKPRENGKQGSIHIVGLTEYAVEWLRETELEIGMLRPQMLPLKIQPRDWTGQNSGGYYTPRMKMQFIKTKTKTHRNWIRNKRPQAHYDAANKLQSTAWRINKRVLDVQEIVFKKELGIGTPAASPAPMPVFPSHLADKKDEELTVAEAAEKVAWKVATKEAHFHERKRKSQVIMFLRGFNLAKELRDWEEFYFAFNTDFRGRFYCATDTLSPQGADIHRGLIEFKRGKPLGEHGGKWLAIHGANVFGENGSFADKLAWVKENTPYVQQVVDDPISYRSFWSEADKPYQFLAWCFEWVDSQYGQNQDYISHIKIALDGSCNGLQHFSAMLRDEVGAHATNLINTESPNDIYQEVANVLIGKLEERTSEPLARKWLKLGITRKCTKRPVMTTPYSATQRSCRAYVEEYIRDNRHKMKISDMEVLEMSKYLTPILWTSIHEVVVAAMKAMNWLSKTVGDKQVGWVTPVGFPVFQYYQKTPRKHLKTHLDGDMFYWDTDAKGTNDKTKQKSGIVPNFVHSIDATHLVMTVNKTEGLDLGIIHDDFGTHAGDTEEFSKIIREAMYELYTGENPLLSYAKQRKIDVYYEDEELPRKTTPTLPRDGKYNIEEIMEAKYFFS